LTGSSVNATYVPLLAEPDLWDGKMPRISRIGALGAQLRQRIVYFVHLEAYDLKTDSKKFSFNVKTSILGRATSVR
jgi:hypothetical protein